MDDSFNCWPDQLNVWLEQSSLHAIPANCSALEVCVYKFKLGIHYWYIHGALRKYCGIPHSSYNQICESIALSLRHRNFQNTFRKILKYSDLVQKGVKFLSLSMRWNVFQWPYCDRGSVSDTLVTFWQQAMSGDLRRPGAQTKNKVTWQEFKQDKKQSRTICSIFMAFDTQVAFNLR